MADDIDHRDTVPKYVYDQEVAARQQAEYERDSYKSLFIEYRDFCDGLLDRLTEMKRNVGTPKEKWETMEDAGALFRRMSEAASNFAKTVRHAQGGPRGEDAS